MVLPKSGAHVHLLGICGTAMASLAGLLKAKGYHVTGSDQNPYPPMSTQLANLGISIMKGYSAENLAKKPDFVIVGNVISKGNPEAQALLASDIPYTSLPKALGEWVIENRTSLVVAGTHGKTTITSLLSWVCDQCGKKPGFMIGGIPKNFSLSFRNPEGDFFVIEGDEYDTAFFDKVPKFVHYRPSHVILSSVEFDHADIYRDLNHVKEAFSMLMKRLPAHGVLMFWGEDENVRQMAQLATTDNKFSYGIMGSSGDGQCDYQCDYQGEVISQSEFRVTFRGSKKLGVFQTNLTGQYNLLNALGVIGLAHQLGWNLQDVAKGISTFLGVKRRQEILGEPGGVLVIEDFAHHPTAVKNTVEAIQNKYSGRRVISVFEPRSATSRRKVFQAQYVEAFQNAHMACIAQAFDQSKIQEGERFSSDQLVKELCGKGVEAHLFADTAAILDFLISKAKSGDVILIMSNGGFDGIYEKLLKGLAR